MMPLISRLCLSLCVSACGLATFLFMIYDMMSPYIVGNHIFIYFCVIYLLLAAADDAPISHTCLYGVSMLCRHMERVDEAWPWVLLVYGSGQGSRSFLCGGCCIIFFNIAAVGVRELWWGVCYIIWILIWGLGKCILE